MNHKNKQKPHSAVPPDSKKVMPELDSVLTYIDQLREVSKQKREQFDEVQTNCIFIGYPRSGHSLVGSLLDAHPDIVLAHELDALRCVQASFNQYMIYQLILANTRKFNQLNREWSGYNYRVDGQWQGRFRTIKVIGDKKGGSTSRRLFKQPALLKRLEGAFSVPVRYIHVLRNPFDNISTIAARRGVDLDRATHHYFEFVESVMAVKANVDAERVIDVAHEAFIADPREALRHLCGFLGVEVDQDWLEACASIVRTEPHKTRHDNPDWTPERIGQVSRLIRKVDFLAGYTFDD